MEALTYRSSLREIIQRSNNDYTSLEPFLDESPITSTIIIPAYNHPETLDVMLSNLEGQKEIREHPEYFQILVIDDGSTTNLDDTVKDRKLPLTYHKLPVNMGRSFARNTGIEKATGDLLFFFDSDVLLPQNYFAKHWAVHNSGKAVAVGLAENIRPNDERITALGQGQDMRPDLSKDYRFFTNTFRRSYEGNEYRLMLQTNAFKKFGTNNQLDFWTLPDMVVTHNISVPRTDALAVGGFDIRFKGWGYEDTHFGAKLIANGNYVVPVTTTGVFRIKHPPREGSDEKRMQEADANKLVYNRLMDGECPVYGLSTL